VSLLSKPKGFEKPIGVRDYLPYAVDKLRAIESKMLACMASWGYRQIMTPTMEYYETVGTASSTSDHKLFKLLNNRGTQMVLRSDMTAPIARVVSSLLKDEPLPLRLSYHANVFRTIEEEAGREAEFYQTGVELVGDDSAEADAEVIALAISSLQAAGVSQFKMALGHVGFLDGILQETLPTLGEAREGLKGKLLERDYVGYKELLGTLSLADGQKKELEGLLRLRGGKEICEQAKLLSQHPLSIGAMEHLIKIWDVLEDYGVAQHVVIDLTMIGDFTYYTGMTFEGYASELGSPVCNGGRYDNLLQQLGRPAPATGFSIKTNRILDGVHGLEVAYEAPILITYVASRRKEAFDRANGLREAGRKVITSEINTEVGFSNDAVEATGKLENNEEQGQRLYSEVIVLE
jgi:ATP phosphoribosyltransferase regulatory subunit